MDIELLAQALENDENMSIINTSIQEIKQAKNDILQNIGLNKNDLKQYHKKLNNYRYIDNIKDFTKPSVLKSFKAAIDDRNRENETLIIDLRSIKENKIVKLY